MGLMRAGRRTAAPPYLRLALAGDTRVTGTTSDVAFVHPLPDRNARPAMLGPSFVLRRTGVALGIVTPLATVVRRADVASCARDFVRLIEVLIDTTRRQPYATVSRMG